MGDVRDSRLSPLGPLCITEGTHAIVRPKPRRPSGRTEQGFAYTGGGGVTPGAVTALSAPVPTPTPTALTSRPLIQHNVKLRPLHAASPRPLPLPNNHDSSKLLNGELEHPPRARLSLPPQRICRSQEELDTKTQRSPVLRELKERKTGGSSGALPTVGSSPVSHPLIKVEIEREESTAATGNEENRKPVVRMPHPRRDVKVHKSVKHFNKYNSTGSSSAGGGADNATHRHISVDQLRLIQVGRHEEGSSSDDTRSSGHASMSDTLSSSPGAPYRSSLHAVPEEGQPSKTRAKPTAARTRHRATPAKLVPAGSGLEDIKLAIEQLTLKSGGYSTSTYSSQSGSESSEPVVRRLIRHSSLETINTNITAADEFLWVDSHNRLVEVQQLPWSVHCVYRVLASGRTKELCGRVSMDTMPRLSYLLQRALVRVAREAQRLARPVGFASKHEMSSALQITLCPTLSDAAIKACLRSAAMLAVSSDCSLPRQSKSSRAGLQFSVGRFHRWMVDVHIAKFVHEYAAVYLTAGMETLLEEMVFQCMPTDGDAMLTPTMLEHAIANNGDLWGLLQPYAHLNAGRVASGALAMDVAGSMSSSSSHSSSGGGGAGSVQQSLATTCVGSTQQLRSLLTRVQHLHRPTVTFTQSAVSTLHYFMRCSQLEHGAARVQELVYERTYVVLPPLQEWLRVATAHAEYRHSSHIDSDDVMQAARLLLPGVDCPVRPLGVEETDAVRNVKVEAAFKLLCSGRPELIAHGVAMLPNGKINTVSDTGYSALMLAGISGDSNAVRCLLDAGADPDVETPLLPHVETPYWTPLCYTALQGNVGLARLLLERGAHVEGGWKASEDRCTLTPLQLAVATGSTEMVSLLLAHGANACLSTLDKDSLCYSGAAQRGSPCAIAVAACHGQRATLHKLLSHPLVTPATKEVLSLEEILAEGATHERPVPSHKPQMKALQEAMYHGCEAGHVELTLELRQLGVAWTLHCWMTTLGTASDARHDSVVDALLQDFVPSWPDDSAQFVDECLPLLFNIFRYTKKEGTALLLADIFSACYGWDPPRAVAPPPRPPSARIDPTFVNNPELSDVQFRVEGRVLYAHKLVLVTGSPRFRNMLSSRLCEGSPPVVQINDIRYSVFQLVMQYLYGGGDNLTIPDTDVLELMAAANFFQLEGLVQLTEAKAAQMVDLDNVVSMYIHAKVYNAGQLLEHCQGFLLQNMVALLTYDDSVKRLMFGNKINSHDVLAGLMATLQARIKQRHRPSTQ